MLTTRVLLATSVAVALLGAPASAQLTDLQPGRNFPASVPAFGADRAENIDAGDIDNDGDFDVVVANGGDGSAQPNRIFVNQGGWQGGLEGTFVQETDTRFPGAPLDSSRDVEFADFEGDGDLDIVFANRGGSFVGAPSRLFRNLGGQQAGTLGVFTETTNTDWGQLLSVDPEDEVGVQDGKGPWGDWSCDCDFGDFDDDGAIDLFHSSYGPNVNGAVDSRLFLNDGRGNFDETFPWADASADTRLHTFDVDLADLDGDFDIDVFASSRDSQSRVYRNNLDGAATWSGDAFTDVTQTALLATGAGVNGTNTYETEYADLDGDGDFDIWMTNYDGGGGGNLDRILRNDGNMTFSKQPAWIKGDPNVDENETDFFDYDGDGDLDAFVANFLGSNWIFQGGLAQGLDPDTEGLFHRNGTSSGGSLASWPEAPSSGISTTSLDADCVDIDGDGDPDALVSNDANQTNRLWTNTLGIPDTHAPTFAQVTVQGDKSDGSDTVIHSQVRDNAAWYVIGHYDVRLFYSVDGGDQACVPMTPQGGQQFRAVIPGGLSGNISYHVEALDDAGNTGVSAPLAYLQSSSAPLPWETLGCGTAGSAGVPLFLGSGDPVPGGTIRLDLRRAAADSLAGLWITSATTPVPFKGGTLYAFPLLADVALLTDPGGQALIQLPVPGDAPAGFPVVWQCLIQDPAALGDVALSNALRTVVQP